MILLRILNICVIMFKPNLGDETTAPDPPAMSMQTLQFLSKDPPLLAQADGVPLLGWGSAHAKGEDMASASATIAAAARQHLRLKAPRECRRLRKSLALAAMRRLLFFPTCATSRS